MKNNTVTVHVRTKGAEKMTKQVSMLSKSIEVFFATGKKFKIPKTILIKMLEWQVDHKRVTQEIKL